MEMQFSSPLFNILGGVWAIICAVLFIWFSAVIIYYLIDSIKHRTKK